MTNWPIASPAGTHDNPSRKNPVRTCMVRMEVKASMSVFEGLETVCAQITRFFFSSYTRTQNEDKFKSPLEEQYFLLLLIMRACMPMTSI